MIENKCSKCGKQVEYTIELQTDRNAKDTKPKDYDIVRMHNLQIIEKWCLRCLYTLIS